MISFQIYLSSFLMPKNILSISYWISASFSLSISSYRLSLNSYLLSPSILILSSVILLLMSSYLRRGNLSLSLTQTWTGLAFRRMYYFSKPPSLTSFPNSYRSLVLYWISSPSATKFYFSFLSSSSSSRATSLSS